MISLNKQSGNSSEITMKTNEKPFLSASPARNLNLVPFFPNTANNQLSYMRHINLKCKY